MQIKNCYSYILKKLRFAVLLCILLIYCSGISAQSILMDSVNNTCSNAIIGIPVRVKSFKKIIGIQGSINWDTTFFKYYNISYTPSAIALSTSNFNFNNISLGTITYVWTDPNVVAQTIADSTILVTLQFKVSKSIIGAKNINFTSTPTPLEIVSIDSMGSYSISKNTSYQMSVINYVSQPIISQNQDTLHAIVSGLPSYYQWNLNTIPISGANSNTYNNANVLGGNYSVTIKYANGCSATSSTVLPITQTILTGYSEKIHNKQKVIHLNWQNTHVQTQQKYFLEKSFNRIDFFTINQNKEITTNHFNDTINEVEANCIYRLLMIDNIGNYFYSNSANVPLTENDVLQYYPNPAKNFLNICLNKDSQELETIVIKNWLY